MQSKLPKIREYYARVSQKVKSDPFDVNLAKQNQRYKQIAQKQQQNQVDSNQYENLQQINFYVMKFTNLNSLISDQAKNKITSVQYAKQANILFNDQYIPLSVIANPSVSVLPNITANPGQIPNTMDNSRASMNNSRIDARNVSPQRANLERFFGTKLMEATKNNNNFGSLLTQPPISPSNFKKKKVQDRQDINRLRQENEQLKAMLQNNTQSNQQRFRMQQRYNTNKVQIHSLQQMNSQLSRENYRLLSQKSSSNVSSNAYSDDYMYSPYTFEMRNNNIYEINMRNLSSSDYYFSGTENQLSQYDPKSYKKPQKIVLHKKVGYQYETYSQIDYNNDRLAPNNFSIFDMNRSNYSENGDFSMTKRGVESERTAIRNKVAFFRQKCLLVRNEDIEIGVKHYDWTNQNKVRVILYFNNRTREPKQIRTNYDYQQDYFEVNIVQRIRQIQSFRQEREVIEVKLRPNKADISSYIDVTVYVGKDTYRLWLPAMFLKISKSRGGMSGNQQSLTFVPSKPFKSPTQASKIIQNLNIINNEQAQFWVDSLKGSGLVKMKWKADRNTLKISTNKIWLNFIGFLMVDTP